MDPTTTATSTASATSTATAGSVGAAAAGATARRRFPVPPRPARGPLARAGSGPSLRPAGRGRVRIPELALGIGLAAAGALASVLWASRAPSQRVLVAARALQRGEALDASMIRWATVSGDRIAAVADPTLLRGGVLNLDVAAGAPLQTDMLTAPGALAANEVELALALEPGDYPPALAAGDRAWMVIIRPTDPMGATPNPQVIDAPVRVRSVSTSESASGSRTIVTLAVPQENAATVLAAARVRLALLPDNGGR